MTRKPVTRLPNDFGGQQAKPVRQALEPWEKRCHARADVLDFQKIINTEDNRRGIGPSGFETTSKLTYCERRIVVFANILFQKDILVPTDVARKMDEVKTRRTGSQPSHQE